MIISMYKPYNEHPVVYIRQMYWSVCIYISYVFSHASVVLDLYLYKQLSTIIPGYTNSTLV